MATAGFRLRKFLTNSEELRHRIEHDERRREDGGAEQLASQLAPGIGATDATHVEEDQSYAKSSLGVAENERQGVHKILGIQWDTARDDFHFDIKEVASAMESSEPTKRSVVSATAKFFDPLGIVSPVTILFKMFAQQLCEARIGWDEPLTGELLKQWKCLLVTLRSAKAIVVPRFLCPSGIGSIQSAKLVGFCDASSKAYAAVVYLRLESEEHKVSVQFVAAKTRVAPVGGATIPRLELLSALILSQLMDSIHTALETELQLGDPVCFSDSMVALYWIRGTNHEWKQFVENRVNTIRNLVAPQCWQHCPGKENPADIPSRGMTASELADTPLWLHGPEWLHHSEELPEEPELTQPLPEECKHEMKRNDAANLLVDAQVPSAPRLSQVINPELYSSAYRLFRVTGLVLRFIRNLRRRRDHPAPNASTPLSDIEQARLYWVKDCQSTLQGDSQFSSWKCRLGLFLDESGIWRCGGRMSKSCLSSSAKNPILLDRSH